MLVFSLLILIAFKALLYAMNANKGDDKCEITLIIAQYFFYLELKLYRVVAFLGIDQQIHSNQLCGLIYCCIQ